MSFSANVASSYDSIYYRPTGAHNNQTFGLKMSNITQKAHSEIEKHFLSYIMKTR